jgi:hypothetical protein
MPTPVADRLGLRRRRFEAVARSGAWSETGESVSGSGSSLDATNTLRAELPGLLRDLDVRTLLDVPCGDWNWMAQVELPVSSYIGGDIVPHLVEQNRATHGSRTRRFVVLDLCTDSLPPADLLLCRDALIHFSIADVWRALENIARADITYLATTTFTATTVNLDQKTGKPWRHLNLQVAPFSFPEPIRVVVDNYNREDQRLAVWKVIDLPVAASARRR